MIKTFVDCPYRREHIGRFMNGDTPMEDGKLYDLSKCLVSWIDGFGYVGCIYIIDESKCPRGYMR